MARIGHLPRESERRGFLAPVIRAFGASEPDPADLAVHGKGSMIRCMKVLLAVDGSEHSMQTLNTVRATAWPPETTVRVVSAVTYSLPPSAAPTWAGVSVGVEEYEEALRNSAERWAARAAEVLDREGLTVETVVRTGDLRRVILDEAKQWSADLIVLGSPGVGGLKRWLHSSVAQYVVARAPCSVEVVRTKAAA